MYLEITIFRIIKDRICNNRVSITSIYGKLNSVAVNGNKQDRIKFCSPFSIRRDTRIHTRRPVSSKYNIAFEYVSAIGIPDMGMQGVVYDYQWDIQVDASEFEPIIPEDFIAFPTDGMKMPAINEEAAIEGLKFFAEVMGRYPENLNLMTLMQEFGKLKDGQSPAAEQLRQKLEQAKSEEEKATELMDMMRPVQSLGMFYITLVQDKKEPAYYGESVSPNDADAVLMRWKISDNQYRVIFGDLSTEDVAAEELAELEKLLPE